jgi:hypothetical protein
MWEWSYRSTYSFLTSALNGISDQLHDPFALPPGNKTLVHIDYRAGRAIALVALVGKEINLCPYWESNYD